MWSDRYRPFWLQDFLCNREKALWLQKMVRSWQDKQEECGHFIFEGNTGVGKRTMIWALLREAFGPDKVQVNPNSHLIMKLANERSLAYTSILHHTFSDLLCFVIHRQEKKARNFT